MHPARRWPAVLSAAIAAVLTVPLPVTVASAARRERERGSHAPWRWPALARGAEQLLIDDRGLGGLDNLINSISFSNPNFMNCATQGRYALRAQGAAPF
jgi:hypothetical protein